MGNYFNKTALKNYQSQQSSSINTPSHHIRITSETSTCISFADSSKAVQILLIIFLNLYFIFLCCLHLEIYMLKTWPLPCTVVVCGGRGRNQCVPRLVLNGWGIAVPEIFGAIREDSRWCVYVRISAQQIVSNRSLSLWAHWKVLFARANAF